MSSDAPHVKLQVNVAYATIEEGSTKLITVLHALCTIPPMVTAVNAMSAFLIIFKLLVLITITTTIKN